MTPITWRTGTVAQGAYLTEDLPYMSVRELTLAIGAGIVACFLLAWLLLLVLTDHWRRKSDRRTRQVAQDLDDLARSFSQITRKARHYPPDAPEPYGHIAHELHQGLAQVHEGYEACSRLHGQLGQQRPLLPQGRMQRLWFYLSSEFLYQRRRYRETGSLCKTTCAVQTEIDQARQSLQELQGMPLQVARRSQGLRTEIAGISALGRALQKAGVQGKRFDEATNEARGLYDRLRRLPAWCAEGMEDPAVLRASKESTVQAWQVLEDLGGPIRMVRATFQRWHDRHQEVGQALQAIQLALCVPHQNLARVAHSIDVGDRAFQLNLLDELAQDMVALYRAPTIENLEALHSHAPQVTEQANELGALFESIVRAFERLRAATVINTELIGKIEVEMDTLARASNYPIDWESHRETLARLHHLRASIGQVTDRRAPERLREHARMAEDLLDEAQALEQAVVEVRDRRLALLDLLQSPELAPQPAWLKQARDLHDRVQVPAADNWPTQVAMSQILQDSGQLAQRKQTWVPQSASAPLPVAQLDVRLSEVRELVADLETFQGRLRRVERMLPTLETLDRLIPILGNAQPALGSRAIAYRQQLESAQQQGHRLISDLQSSNARRARARVDQGDGWASACQSTLQALAQALHEEIGALATELQIDVDGLRVLAPFDRETAMQEAQRLLRHDRPPGPPSPGKRATAQLQPLVDYVERALQDRASLHTALENLRAQIRDRVVGPSETLNKARQEALAERDMLFDLKGESEAEWPYLQCDTRRVENLWDSVQRDENALRRSGDTVRVVVRRVDNITRGYRDVLAEVQAREEQTRDERSRLQGEWDRLDRWRGSLESYRRRHRQERDVADAIRRRLDKIDSAIDTRRRRRRPRTMTYDQARQALQELWSLAHGEDLPVKGRDAPIRIRDIEAEFPI